MKTCISVKELYEKKGSQLTYGRIEKTDMDGEEWFDLYNARGELFCCDGENIRVVSKENGYAALESCDGSVAMRLSQDEYDTAIFAERCCA